jgi:hypothetical protein
MAGSIARRGFGAFGSVSGASRVRAFERSLSRTRAVTSRRDDADATTPRADRIA